MMDWKETELKDITTKIGSGATPKGGQEAYKDEGISLIRSQNILDFSFSYSGLAFIDDDQAYGLRNVIVEENDILINITGDSVARVAKVPVNVLPARVNQHVAILRANEKILDPDYLLYYLLNPTIKRYLLRIASDGGTRDALTKSNLEELVIKIPESLQEQKQIARTLSLLDQKINLLRQQNETLEQLAQTLFKRWFVDFEFPDENGQPYQSSGGEMVDSELGEVPAGWEVKRIGDLDLYISDLVANGSFASIKENVKTSDKENYALFVRNTDLKDDFNKHKIFVDKHAYDFLKKSVLYGGEIILPNVGDVGTVHICPYLDMPMTLGNNCIMVRSKKIQNWLYTFFKSKSGFYSLRSAVVGSVQDKLSKTNFKNIELIIPNSKTLTLFENISKSQYEKIFQNKDQIQTLTTLRDTLLPKLMSGELRVGV